MVIMCNGSSFAQACIKEFSIQSDSNPGKETSGNDHMDMGEIRHHLG